MRTQTAIVLRTAGTNCDGETVAALSRAGARAELVHLERLVREPARLEAARMVVLPGGFSYGDDVGAGRVLGLELRANLAREFSAFVARGGFVLGICNGFQALLEARLLDAPPAPSAPKQRSLALSGNAQNRFECRWITLRSEECACPWLVAGELWPAPVAHAEGRLVARDDGALERLREAGQIALRYARADGGHPAYPDNPNGSLDDIAGLCDPSGRVLGLMPHPERNVDSWHHPFWTRLPARDEGEGLAFFRRMVDAAACAPV